ncbi:MAG: DUF4124 domain-containing protein [Panacagrimonas sp.]
MRGFWWLSLGCLLAAATAAEAGKVYRWVDAKGQTHYSDVPDGNAREVEEVKVRAGAEETRQEIPAPDAALEETRRIAACTAKQQQLDTYETSVRLIEKDNLGREREFSPEDKATLIERTRVEVVQLCGEEEAPG